MECLLRYRGKDFTAQDVFDNEDYSDCEARIAALNFSG